LLTEKEGTIGTGRVIKGKKVLYRRDARATPRKNKNNQVGGKGSNHKKEKRKKGARDPSKKKKEKEKRHGREAFQNRKKKKEPRTRKRYTDQNGGGWHTQG